MKTSNQVSQFPQPLNTDFANRPHSNVNVMETLVAEEVKQQLSTYPPQLVQYLNQIEIETYALNRLPPLYASCAEGWKKQKLRAESEFKKQIAQAVRQAFAAVQRDPIRFSTPLAQENDAEAQKAKEALDVLQEILQLKEPSWKGLAFMVKQALSRAALTSMTAVQRERFSCESTDSWNEYHASYRY